MDDFFGVVDDMRNNIETMKTKSAAMKKLTADLLLQTDDTKLELERELDGLVADVKKVSNQGRNHDQVTKSVVKMPNARTGIIPELKKQLYGLVANAKGEAEARRQ